jgi:hypothetical protein
LFDSVDRCDVWVIHRGENARFTLKTCSTFGIVSESFGQELDGDTTAQLRIGGLIDVSL